MMRFPRNHATYLRQWARVVDLLRGPATDVTTEEALAAVCNRAAIGDSNYAHLWGMFARIDNDIAHALQVAPVLWQMEFARWAQQWGFREAAWWQAICRVWLGDPCP